MPRWDNDLQIGDAVQQLKRDAVVRAAGNAFSKRGYHNTSLDDVAAALKVSKGTLYNYVRDKQEILFQCHLMAIEIGKRAFEKGSVPGACGAEVLEETLKDYIEMLTTELGACGVIMEVDALRPEDRKLVTKERDAFEARLTKILKSGFADGSIRETDPRIAIFAFMGAINWMPRWYSPEGRLSGREVAEQLTGLLLRGLDARPDASATRSNPRTRKRTG
jgi:AcrR family transcriptional regulator